jgi:PII-like signaling protein
MNTSEVTMVRIYLTESSGQLEPLLKRLHDWEKVRGVTVFRGISGFGESGDVHTAGLVDLSLDMPVVVEFFDEPGKVVDIIDHVSTSIKPRHMVWWRATIHNSEE